jgi:hypothetical protein
MAPTVVVAVAVAAAAAVYKYVSGLQGNIAKARKTGLVYIAVRKWQRTPRSISSQRPPCCVADWPG